MVARSGRGGAGEDRVRIGKNCSVGPFARLSLPGRTPRNQHGAACCADDLLRHAADQHMRQTRAAVRPHDDHPGATAPCGVDDHVRRYAGFDHDTEALAGRAQFVTDVGEFRVAQAALFLVHFRHRDEVNGLNDIEDQQLGTELLGEIAGRAERIERVAGEIDWYQDPFDVHLRLHLIPSPFPGGRGDLLDTSP